MAQIWDILPENIGSSIGKNLGGGLSAGLNQYAQNKMAEMAQAKQQSKLAEALQYLPGVNSDLAKGLSALPESVLQTVLKEQIQNPYMQELANQYADASGVSRPYENAQSSPREMQQNLPQQLQQANQPLINNQNQSVQQQPQQSQANQSQPYKSVPNKVNTNGKFVGKPKDFIALTKYENDLKQRELDREAKNNIAEAKRLEAIENRKLKKELAEQKIQQAERHLERNISVKEQENIDKETLPAYTEINKGAKTYRDTKMRLGRLEEILDEGTGTFAALHEGIRLLGKGIFGVGFDLGPILEGTNAGEFEKISNDFIRDAKDIFGNRVTDADLKSFFKIIPDLGKTDAVNRAIIRNMKIFNEGKRVRKEASEKVIKDNGGRRPRNYESLVEDEAADKLEQLSKQFISNPQPEAPQQDPFIQSVMAKVRNEFPSLRKYNV